MDLKEFIQSTLSQLIDGICQEQKRQTGALVVPPQIWTPDATSQPMVFTSPRDKEDVGRYVSLIEFDVTLVLEKEAKGGGKLKIGVASLGVEGGATGSTSSTNTHRVKFTVPVALPAAKSEKG